MLPPALCQATAVTLVAPFHLPHPTEASDRFCSAWPGMLPAAPGVSRNTCPLHVLPSGNVGISPSGLCCCLAVAALAGRDAESDTSVQIADEVG